VVSRVSLNYFPHPSLFILVFALILGVLMVVLRFVFVEVGFRRLGISRFGAIVLLWASLLGSGLNIPVAQLPAKRVVENTTIDFFGMTYVIPHVVGTEGTIVALNVGGAVIPLVLCCYLILRYGLTIRALAALALVTWLAHTVAHPLQGVGVVMPPLVAAAGAALAAVLLDRANAPRTAFIAGTLGTLIGADLLNLGRMDLMSAPVISIGGAGTFDGVFVTGIGAVLLAGFGPNKPRPEPPSG
jgi:uncharacterized membrane protein